MPERKSSRKQSPALRTVRSGGARTLEELHDLPQFCPPPVLVFAIVHVRAEARLAQLQQGAPFFTRAQRPLHQGRCFLVEIAAGVVIPTPSETMRWLDRLHANRKAAVAVPLEPAEAAGLGIELCAVREPLGDLIRIRERTPNVLEVGAELQPFRDADCFATLRPLGV